MRLWRDRHLSKKACPPATAKSTQACENSRLLTAHNVVPSIRMALRRPGALLFPGQRYRPRCRSPPSHLNFQKIQMGGNGHGIQSWQRRTQMAALETG